MALYTFGWPVCAWVVRSTEPEHITPVSGQCWSCRLNNPVSVRLQYSGHLCLRSDAWRAYLSKGFVNLGFSNPATSMLADLWQSVNLIEHINLGLDQRILNKISVLIFIENWGIAAAKLHKIITFCPWLYLSSSSHTLMQFYVITLRTHTDVNNWCLLLNNYYENPMEGFYCSNQWAIQDRLHLLLISTIN